MTRAALLALAVAGCSGVVGPSASGSDGAAAGSGGSGMPPSGGIGGGGAGGSAGTGGSAGSGGSGGKAGSGGAGGSGGAIDAGGGSGGTGGATGDLEPVFVAVGFRAYRVRSLDLGLTWTDVKTEGESGDNQWVIRGIGFGKGLFVAARGWPNGFVRTSPDGATWTNRMAPTDQWMSGIVFFKDHFVTAGGAVSWVSNDGITWTGKRDFMGLGIRTVVAGGDVLIAAGNGAWWKSTDGGLTWAYDSPHTASNEIKVATCGGQFQEIGDDDYHGLPTCAGFTRCRGAVHAEGVYLRTNDKRIERSTNGTTWTAVHNATEFLLDVEVGHVPLP
jgi:hypothetical protein